MRRVQAVSGWFNSPPWPPELRGYVVLMWRLGPRGERTYIDSKAGN